jgi:hypothetical protein
MSDQRIQGLSLTMLHIPTLFNFESVALTAVTQSPESNGQDPFLSLSKPWELSTSQIVNEMLGGMGRRALRLARLGETRDMGGEAAVKRGVD